MRYIFQQIDDISGHNTVTTVEFKAEQLSDIIEQFHFFLKGSGFHFEGQLDIVNYEEEPFYDAGQPLYEDEHSEYYYDKDRNK